MLKRLRPSRPDFELIFRFLSSVELGVFWAFSALSGPPGRSSSPLLDSPRHSALPRRWIELEEFDFRPLDPDHVAS